MACDPINKSHATRNKILITQGFRHDLRTQGSARNSSIISFEREGQHDSILYTQIDGLLIMSERQSHKPSASATLQSSCYPAYPRELSSCVQTSQCHSRPTIPVLRIFYARQTQTVRQCSHTAGTPWIHQRHEHITGETRLAGEEGHQSLWSLCGHPSQHIDLVSWHFNLPAAPGHTVGTFIQPIKSRISKANLRTHPFISRSSTI
jgi:hypothetical protein